MVQRCDESCSLGWGACAFDVYREAGLVPMNPCAPGAGASVPHFRSRFRVSTRLESPRVVLRAPRATDIPDLRSLLIRNADHLRPLSPSPPPGPTRWALTELGRSIGRHRRDWKAGAGYVFIARFASRASHRRSRRFDVGHARPFSERAARVLDRRRPRGSRTHIGSGRSGARLRVRHPGASPRAGCSDAAQCPRAGASWKTWLPRRRLRRAIFAYRRAMGRPFALRVHRRGMEPEIRIKRDYRAGLAAGRDHRSAATVARIGRLGSGARFDGSVIGSSPARCAGCSAPVMQSSTIFCTSCLTTVERCAGDEGVAAFGHYGGALATAIRKFKYEESPYLARPLGALATMACLARRIRADVIIPVPLHPRRLVQRGYNQAALLGAQVGARLRWPLVTGALVRISDTVPKPSCLEKPGSPMSRGRFAWHAPSCSGGVRWPSSTMFRPPGPHCTPVENVSSRRGQLE